PKKQKAKTTAPESEAEFQEAADFFEDTGGKWRAGDPAKSGRAFIRALDVYSNGILKHPKSFDLAYNKARLELEITQRPALVAHIGRPIVELLEQALGSHRYALQLNEENPDVLFNTSQVLTALAEQLSQADEAGRAIPLLHEALQLLSACLSRQEMLLEEQRRADLEDMRGGGVPLDPDEAPVSTIGCEDSAEMATIERPVTASDLLDTVHASLSALTTIVALVESDGLGTYGDMAESLTELKAPQYVSLLPVNERQSAQAIVALDRAIFIAAFADAQYSAFMIEAETYLARLDEFKVVKDQGDVEALSSEASARTEFALSVLARLEGSPDLPFELCWKQLGLVQDLYGQIVKLESHSQIHLSRGDAEMIRLRIATNKAAGITESIRKAAPILAKNAQTYYRGAM
ncbi:hypothetical protein M433DRAFT_45261, partial [Acidomyces richmondensis BFW]